MYLALADGDEVFGEPFASFPCRVSPTPRPIPWLANAKIATAIASKMTGLRDICRGFASLPSTFSTLVVELVVIASSGELS